MNAWWKPAARGFAFGVLMIVLGMLCTCGCDFTILAIFTAPAIGLSYVGIPGDGLLFFLSPLWWAVMFLCATRPTRKALYGFIAGQCIHFAVAIRVVIESSCWSELASDFVSNLMAFFILSTCFGTYFAGHAFLIWLRMRANRAQKKGEYMT